MKKLFLIAIAALLAYSPVSFAQVTTLWQMSSATGNLPTWFNTSNAQRNMAYGNVGGKDQLYLPYGGKPLTPILILDAATGDSVGTLDTTGISGGVFPLNGIGVSNDGIIFASNLRVNAQTSAFKVYEWTSDTSKPTAVISFADSAYRLGDHITVSGSASDNSLTIWAAASGKNDVLKFTTTDNGASFTCTVIPLNDTQTTGTCPTVSPAGSDFIVSSDLVGVREYDASGNFVGAIAPAPYTAGGVSFLSGGSPTKSFALVYDYNNEYLDIYDVSSGINSANPVTSTTALGTASNLNGTGGIAVKQNSNGVITVFALGTNNGIGAYRFNAWLVPLGMQTLWQMSSATGNLPTWFNTSNAQRNMACGNVGGKDQLYLPYGGKALTPILILDAATGDSVGTLDTTGISGGVFPLNGIGVSNDGIIFASNLTVNAQTSAFKVYEWTSNTAKPTAVISFADSAYRLGDHITVSGSASDNSLTIWAAANGGKDVVKFTTTNNGASFVPTVIPLSDNLPIDPTPKVWPSASGDFFLSSAGNGIKEYSATGTFLGTIASMPTTIGSMAYIAAGVPSKAYVFGYDYTDANSTNPPQFVQAVDVSNGIAGADSVNVTPILGTTANLNGTGDIALKNDSDGTVTLFVLATNNGVAAFNFNGEFTTSVPIADVPQVVSPADSASGVARKTTFTWRSSAYATSYHLQIAIDPSFNRLVFDVTVADTSEQIPDTLAEGSVYYWHVSAVNATGASQYTSTMLFTTGASILAVNQPADVPHQFTLCQNYPNPFNPTTQISYSIPQNAFVTLKVYNVLGQDVATLFSGIRPAGTYTAIFDGSRFASGVYFYRLDAVGADGQRFASTRKLMLVK